MTTLAALGLTGGDDAPLMLIAPPDNVLAEAGQLKPRPSIASTLQVGEPTRRIAWWVERRLLDAAQLSRFHWMIQQTGGEGWLIFDPEDDEALTMAELREAVAQSELVPEDEVELPNGDVALHVLPAG